jgi:hypothetical protein
MERQPGKRTVLRPNVWHMYEDEEHTDDDESVDDGVQRRLSAQLLAAGVGDASAPSAEAWVPGGDAGDGSGLPFLMSALGNGMYRCDCCMLRGVSRTFASKRNAVAHSKGKQHARNCEEAEQHGGWTCSMCECSVSAIEARYPQCATVRLSAVAASGVTPAMPPPLSSTFAAVAPTPRSHAGMEWESTAWAGGPWESVVWYVGFVCYS